MMTESSPQQQQQQRVLLASSSENAVIETRSNGLTNPIKPTTTTTKNNTLPPRKPKKMQSRRSSFSSFASSITNTTTSSSSASGFLMKWLPSRRRQSEEVMRTSFILDDYANVLSRDSNFLASTNPAIGGGGGGNATDAGTVSSGTGTTLSLNEEQSSSVNLKPSVVTVATVGAFQRQEVGLGALLGKGRFSKVYEITSIELEDLLRDEDLMIDDEDASERRARTTMSKNAKAGQYAMKRLRKKLLRGRPRDFTKAAANLVIEAQYLSKLDHPNIIKLRGSALGGASSAFQSGEHDNYFLILDKINETLSDRINNTWAVSRRSNSAINDSELLYQKTHYALQLASALQYLHERRIIYRALCPSSVGFLNTNTKDHTLQLFDFGLARDLPAALGLSNELFHMTQNAGREPFAAPEVSTQGLYNLKADVYSWSMVVYEMMMEQVPFAHLAQKGMNSKKPFANKDFVQAVYIDGERPSFSTTTNEDSAVAAPPPQELQDLLMKCWAVDLFHRPTMEDVFYKLEEILSSLPHHESNTSLQLGMTPPRPTTTVATNTSSSMKREGLSFSDLTNGI